MRLNRSTLLLLLVSVLVIAAVLFLSRDEAQEAGRRHSGRQ